jgi:hypothetical protein
MMCIFLDMTRVGPDKCCNNSTRVYTKQKRPLCKFDKRHEFWREKWLAGLLLLATLGLSA